MQKKNKIYTHTQDSKAIGGIDLVKFPFNEEELQTEYEQSESPFETHRDEYYIFALLTKGYVDFVCDMEDISLSKMTLMDGINLYCIYSRLITVLSDFRFMTGLNV